MPTNDRHTRRHRDKRTIAGFKRRMIREGRTTCHLCGLPIDVDAPQHHPDSFEVDHKTPVAQMTSRRTRYEDVAPAHSRCNRSRGAKPLSEVATAGAVRRAEALGVRLPRPGEYVELPDGIGYFNSVGGVGSRPW